ncbi:MAG TPA: GMC family oxidoreductase [Blastocatellia bacterium]|nr:GMC family oxidoreductase [Blastocatellia bacterium]
MAQKKIYDAIVVGSGAAGATAAHVLVNQGLSVLLLEIGPKWNPLTDYVTSHKWSYEMPYRSLGRPGQYDGLWKINAYTEHLYVNPRVDRYGTAPGTDFHWTRIHAVGGRTITWGRLSLRMAEWDFRQKSMQDGYGEDWPISYEDLAPYYEKAERLMGVSGVRDGLAVLPDGIYMPPPGLRCGEVELKKACDKLGIPAISNRKAVLTQKYDGRSACHYCDGCDRGCETFSRYSTLEALVPKLVGKPNFTLQTRAAAYRVLLDPKTGRARGVSYINTQNKQEYEVYGKAVVLGAGAMESTRILLNSKTREHPNGLANSSGVLGHYLMDSIKSGNVSGYLPRFKGRPVVNEDGAGGGHLYIPRFTNIPAGKGRGRKSSVMRGWQYQPNSGARDFPGYSHSVGGFGSDFKKQVRERNPAMVSMIGFGESLGDFNNYCEIDPDGLRDRYGIPQLRFHCKWGDNDLKMSDAMYDAAEEILRAAGAEINPYQRRTPPPHGDSTHEVGTARMGDDPKTSVLNKWCQAHEVKNLFVADGASFVSVSEKNVTLTITALAWRASAYLAEELRKGNLV